MSRIANNFPTSGTYIASSNFDAQSVCKPDQGGSSAPMVCIIAYSPAPKFNCPPTRIPDCSYSYQPCKLDGRPGRHGHKGAGREGGASFGRSGDYRVSNCRGGDYRPSESSWAPADFRPNCYFGQTGGAYNHKAMRYAERMFDNNAWGSNASSCGPVPWFGPQNGSGNSGFNDCGGRPHHGPHGSNPFFQDWSGDRRGCAPHQGSPRHSSGPRRDDSCEGPKQRHSRHDRNSYCLPPFAKKPEC